MDFCNATSSPAIFPEPPDPALLSFECAHGQHRRVLAFEERINALQSLPLRNRDVQDDVANTTMYR